jgi:peptide/nickel transport system substrate-binding protein
MTSAQLNRRARDGGPGTGRGVGARAIAILASGLMLTLAAVSPTGAVEAGGERLHGIAMHGGPALPPDFTHLPYVNPDAPKGGRLSIGVQGTFDNLNPFTVKGVTVDNVRGYVYESLMARSADEPFSLYGLIAESVSMPADRSSITFHLRSEARFSDGQPVTASDVAFSHGLLKDHGRPFMRSYYKKVTDVVIVDPLTVRFEFDESGDREMPLIMALMPILPKHLVTLDAFQQTTLEPPVGSGPYRISRVDPGRTVIFERDPDYWAANLPIRRGLFNFQEIRFEFFREATAMFEAFKNGTLDFRFETDSVRWAEGYKFPAAEQGRVIHTGIETGLPAGLRALVFNTRRNVFKDIRVRKALIALFDFDWINKSLFNGLYARSDSLFAGSQLAAAGTAMDARERRLLAPFMDQIDPAIADGTWTLPTSDGTGRDRRMLRDAVRLLRDAGYASASGRMVHERTGEPLAFEFLARSKAEERLMLAYKTTLDRIGIDVTIRQVDNAQYWQRLRTFDFDMIQWRWSASLSPGNEQIHRWESSHADVEGSQNYAGARSPAADAMIKALLAARERDAFVSAVRAYDRAILSRRYVIPLYHAPTRWVAYWSHIKKPATDPLFGLELNAWWRAPAEK